MTQSRLRQECFSGSSSGKLGKIHRSRKISGCRRFCGSQGFSGPGGFAWIGAGIRDGAGRSAGRLCPCFRARRLAELVTVPARAAVRRNSHEFRYPASRSRTVGRLAGLPEKIERVIETAADGLKLMLQSVDPAGAWFTGSAGIRLPCRPRGHHKPGHVVERSGGLLRQINIRNRGRTGLGCRHVRACLEIVFRCGVGRFGERTQFSVGWRPVVGFRNQRRLIRRDWLI